MRRTPKLGQHFLTGTWAARKLVQAARIRPADTVLEIGPGKGALTRELLKTGAHVVAVEKDATLITELRELFAPETEKGKLIIVESDVREFDPGSYQLEAGGYILAANIPYYITGEIIRQFLTESRQPRTIALLVQKEVADRIGAKKGKESILSISVKAYGEPEIAAKVSKGNFNPPPAVASSILVVRAISKKRFLKRDEAFFFRIVRLGFSSKRKFLAGNLSKEFDREKVADAFAKLGASEKARAENLSLDQWLGLADALSR